MKRKLLSIVVLVTILMTSMQSIAYASYAGQIADIGQADIPECLSEEALDIQGSSMRLPEEETDLNSIVYQNLDGTRSLYYFQDAVKYVDPSGQVKDKSNKLYRVPAGMTHDIYTYQNVYNDIITKFPETLSQGQGILLENNDVKIKMLPWSNQNVRATTANAELFDETTISYAGVFGPTTSIKYSPTFNGVKEDIVIRSAAIPAITLISIQSTLIFKKMSLWDQRQKAFCGQPTRFPVIMEPVLIIIEVSLIQKDISIQLHNMHPLFVLKDPNA